MINLKQMLTGGEEGGKNPLGEVKSMLVDLTRGKLKKSAELDVTKARLIKELESAKLGQVARDNLRASPQQKSILANIMSKVESDFIELDLKRDLGIKDPKKLAEYRALFREYFTSKMSNEMLLQIYQSKEWDQLNVHVNEVSKYTKLDQIIADCKIAGDTGPWKAFAEKHPMLATAGSWLIGWYVGSKKEKDMSTFDKKLMNIGKILSGEEAKPDPNAPQVATTTPDGKPKPEVKPEDLNEAQKTTIKPLEDAGFVMDLNTVKADMQYLAKQRLDNNKVIAITTAGAESTSNFYKIGKTIMTKLSGKPIKFRLTDVHALQGLSDSQVGDVLKIIEKVEGNPTKMREALNRTRHIKPNDAEEAIERYMQIDPDAQSNDVLQDSTVTSG